MSYFKLCNFSSTFFALKRSLSGGNMTGFSKVLSFYWFFLLHFLHWKCYSPVAIWPDLLRFNIILIFASSLISSLFTLRWLNDRIFWVFIIIFALHILQSKDVFFQGLLCLKFHHLVHNLRNAGGGRFFHFAIPPCTRLTGIDFIRMIHVLTFRRFNVQKKWAWWLDDHASADILLCKLCSLRRFG